MRSLVGDEECQLHASGLPSFQSRRLEVVLSACRSPRLFAILLLLVAATLGAHLRFHRLARASMDGDEGASWAAAVAPDLHRVSALERQLDPGKLPLYHVLLHEWIHVFGDGLFSMRAMSAGLGTIAVVLVFAAVREVCGSLGDGSTLVTGEVAGAFAGLIYATNLTMVLSDRTVRMYPLVLAAELLQIIFLVRAQRHGRLLNYSGVAIFTAIMIATNFTASFLLLAEGLWFGCLLLCRKWADARAKELGILLPGLAIAAGILLLAPMLPKAVATAKAAVDYGAIDWITLQPPSWPFTTLRNAAGNNQVFWLFLSLGAYGALRQWRSARLASGFFSAWLLGPLIGVLAVTYLLKPLQFPRYVIVAYVAMFALAGLGAASLRYFFFRSAVAVLIVHLSLGIVHSWLKHSHQEDWSTAASVAAANIRGGGKIAVFPAWTVNVARYYSPRERRDSVVGVDSECGSAEILIISGWNLSRSDKIAKIEACYPRLLARPFLMEVRAR